MEQKPYYTIGEVSELCGLPIKTLRYYDTIGLISPEQRNVDSNYRYYSKTQLITVFIIRHLKKMGFSLKEIKTIVSQNNTKAIENSMQNKLDQMCKDIEESLLLYSEGKCLLERLKKGVNILEAYADAVTSSEYNEKKAVQIEHIPEINLLYNRKLMEHYKNSEVSLDRWIEIIADAQKQKLKISGPIYVTFVTDNLLDKFISKDIKVEFAIQVDSGETDAPIKKFGAFDAATAIHVGKYSNIINTYIELINWIGQNGYEINGNATEEFIISPIDIENEAEHITRIILPIKPIETHKKASKKPAVVLAQ